MIHYRCSTHPTLLHERHREMDDFLRSMQDSDTPIDWSVIDDVVEAQVQAIHEQWVHDMAEWHRAREIDEDQSTPRQEELK